MGIVKLSRIGLTAPQHAWFTAGLEPIILGVGQSNFVNFTVPGQGLFEVTNRIQDVVSGAGVREGLCTVMLQHTSASLTIQENADPSARRDLEAWLNRLVTEAAPHFTHTQEGPDDMPSHIKARRRHSRSRSKTDV